MVGGGGFLYWTDVKGDNVQRLQVRVQGLFQALPQTNAKQVN